MRVQFIFKGKGAYYKTEIYGIDSLPRKGDIVKLSKKDIDLYEQKERKSLYSEDSVMPRLIQMPDGKRIRVEDSSDKIKEEIIEKRMNNICRCKHVNNVEFMYEENLYIIKVGESESTLKGRDAVETAMAVNGVGTFES